MTDKLVLTPGGFRSRSLVHLIEPGYGLRLDDGVMKQVELATDRLFDLPPASGEAIAPKAPPPAASGELPAMGSGWIAYAGWTAATPIAQLSATWIVPPLPPTYTGQTLFLFNGIQNGGLTVGILQPVLQFGISAAGGGNYWAIASWYVATDGRAYFTKLVPVSPGKSLVGVMRQTDHFGMMYSYESQFLGFPETVLPIQNIMALMWANVALEAYSIQQCSEYPPSSSTAFAEIDLQVGSARPALDWSPFDQITDCGQHVVIASNANPGGKINLCYRR